MAVLGHGEILRLHAAAINLRLADEREALLVGLAPEFLQGLPRASGPSAQILVDLGILNATERLAGGVPLRIWIQNALALSSLQPEADVFRRALALVEAAPRNSFLEASAGESLGKIDDIREDELQIGLLVRTRLPCLLVAFEPRPVLVRAGVPTDMLAGELRLDKWTYVCEWLSKAGIRGIVFTFRIIEQVQSEAFSERLSRWAAEFITLVLKSMGGGAVPVSTLLVL